IFSNPYVVAQQVHTPLLILGAWAVGGLIALAGAFIYAELSSQVTASGGQYVYLRDAMHPLVAFLYGWSLLFVIQTGGMAAVALIFANHLFELIGVRSSEFSAALLGSAALVLLTAINCIGVRAGSLTQIIYMILQLIAIATNSARCIAVGNAISTIAVLTQSMLTAPRVYFAMAEDGLCFKQLASVNRARVPAFAIALQGGLAIVSALVASKYEQILNYVVSVDVIFFGLTAVCIFVFRSRDRNPTVREGAVQEASKSQGTLPDGRVSVRAF